MANGGAWLLILFPVALALIPLIPLLLPAVSRRRGATRARRTGAVWVGLANFDARDTDQADVVRRALARRIIAAATHADGSEASERPRRVLRCVLGRSRRAGSGF